MKERLKECMSEWELKLKRITERESVTERKKIKRDNMKENKSWERGSEGEWKKETERERKK